VEDVYLILEGPLRLCLVFGYSSSESKKGACCFASFLRNIWVPLAAELVAMFQFRGCYVSFHFS
jgi:hypothetical protein